MLNIVEKFTNEYDIKINTSKTVYMVFNEKVKRNKTIEIADSIRSLTLDGKFLNRVDEMKYLGNYLMGTLQNTKHLTESIRKTVGSSFSSIRLISTLAK